MTVLTPNYSLPVPGPLDEPCDFPAQWCDFTEAVQVVLDGFEAVANRTNPNVPVAKMELRNTVTLTEDSAVPFDTLTLNNAGMVDFDSSNSSLIIKRPGRWFFIFNVLFIASTSSSTYFSIEYSPAGGGTINRTPAVDDNLNVGVINVGSCASAVLYVTAPPVNVSIIVEQFAVLANVGIDLASLSAFWYADGASP